MTPLQKVLRTLGKVGGGWYDLKKGGIPMASNFKLFFHKTRDSIHMKMCGDFDGTSAFELITAIQKHAYKSNQVFIHTEDLGNIYSFGKDVFQNNLGVLKKQLNKIVFVGKHQDSLIL